MGGDKHGSKSGRYVGGFLQLFDWNAKSRKKLFPSKSDLPEQPKQGKKSEGNFPSTRIRVVDEDEFGAGLSIRGGSEYSCASSVTDDDGYGTKAPSVVARLMGLDSLPTTNPFESYSTPFLDTLSLQDVPFRGRNLDLYLQDHQIMHSRHMSEKAGSPPRIALGSRHQNISNSRPIEKFQSEMLPPKSAKTIPITHHKLLSPIKSPIFVPSQDAAHIMEAAAKIIEPGPQATPRRRISSVGSSSVPFKVRELREKLEAAQRPSKNAAEPPFQRPVESNAAKFLRGQPMNKSWNGGLDETRSSFRVSPSRDDSSGGGKSRGKSISLAIQAKVNVQKREGLATSNRSLGGTEEQDDPKSTSIQSFKSQPNGPRTSTRKSSASSVLRQNNQKQNCSTIRERPASSKNSVPTSTGKKAVTEDSSHGRQRTFNGSSRTGSRKSRLQAREGDREVSYSGVRNVPRKKRSIEGNSHFKNQVTDNMQATRNEKPSYGSVTDRPCTWIEESRRKGMDVVSFTFTAPITRSSELAGQLAEKSSNLFGNGRSKNLSSPGLNVIGGDALSILLEQKLKELTSNLDTSNHHQNLIKTLESAQQTGIAEYASEKARAEKNVDGQTYSAFSSTEPEEFRRKYNLQVVEPNSSSKPETKQQNDCHLPSPVSTLEPSTLTESWYSSESITSSTSEGSKQCSSSVQAQEVIGSSFLKKKLHTTETETETSDSASSSTLSRKFGAAKDSMKPTTKSWELGYVKDILCNVELMFKDYATGRTREIVNPHLFDQMERRRGGVGKDELTLERRVMFDCVSECLDLKCQRFVGGGFETWSKGIATVKRNERLAEEVYKEVQGWTSLGHSNVDELVDKDMSSKYGRWLDFEVDEFDLGVEIEGQIVDSLVVEIIADFLPSNLSFW